LIRGIGEFVFSGKKVKTPTLPNAGRVGHPRRLSNAGKTRNTGAILMLLKTQNAVILSEAKNLSLFFMLKMTEQGIFSDETISFEQFSNETSNSS